MESVNDVLLRMQQDFPGFTRLEILAFMFESPSFYWAGRAGSLTLVPGFAISGSPAALSAEQQHIIKSAATVRGLRRARRAVRATADGVGGSLVFLSEFSSILNITEHARADWLSAAKNFIEAFEVGKLRLLPGKHRHLAFAWEAVEKAVTLREIRELRKRLAQHATQRSSAETPEGT